MAFFELIPQLWSFLRTFYEMSLWSQSHKYVRPIGFLGEGAMQRPLSLGLRNKKQGVARSLKDWMTVWAQEWR